MVMIFGDDFGVVILLETKYGDDFMVMIFQGVSNMVMIFGNHHHIW